MRTLLPATVFWQRREDYLQGHRSSGRIRMATKRCIKNQMNSIAGTIIAAVSFTFGGTIF